MSVSELPPGTYRGLVEGPESGRCTARVVVRAAPGGCRTVDYEAVSDEHGLQHIEHAILAEGSLHVAYGEGSGVTVFHATVPGSYETTTEPRMRIVAAYDADLDELTWAWHWGVNGGELIERSRARCRRTTC